MGFTVAFHPGRPQHAENALAAEEDFETLVMQLCTVLESWEGSHFSMSGFGRESWPVEVGYDLSVFIEQLPGLLASLKAEEEFRLDMYSQGIEALLEFRPDNDHVMITCTSRTAWQAQPTTERVARSALIATLQRFAADVAVAASFVSPAVANTPPWKQWALWANDAQSLNHRARTP